MKRSKQTGAFLPLMAISVIALLALVGLVIDGARLFISATQNNRVAKIAAQLAIREYATFIPPPNTTDVHEAKMQHVNRQIALLLNDDLNSIFGYSSPEVVRLGGGDLSFDEGLILTPGQYYSRPEGIEDLNQRELCRNNSADLGCWIAYTPGGGVNSFRAEVKTPSFSLIKLVFLKVISSKEFSIEDEAFSYLKPRVFLNLVDMSESITEGNFNSFGRYRSKFMFRFGGASTSGGTGCISPIGSLSPSCSFDPVKDDQAWNGEFYSNEYSINDDRCESPGDPNCVLIEERMCSDGSLTGYLWALGHHWWTSGILGQVSHVPACSPVYWTEDNTIKPCGRRSCFNSSLSNYRRYGYRFLGDTRPNLIFDTDGVARQPHFFRFKNDYFNHTVNLDRAELSPSGELQSSALSTTGGTFLVEDPTGVRNDSFNVRDHGWNTTYLHGRPLDPDGYFRFENCEGNAYTDSYSCRARRGFMMHRLQPDYEGPEPYNSLLKGLWFIHNRTAAQNVPGDMFGALFFDSTLTAYNAQVPLSPVLRDGATPATNQEKLEDLLNVIDPTRPENFWSVQRIKERLNLGLFPDPLAPETNISHAISLAVKYMESVPNFQGADVYLNVFTDFVAFSHCNFQRDVDDDAIEDCLEKSGLSADKAPANQRAPERLRGMINDLIGWPHGSNQRYKGLISYLKDKDIKPIFFSFNGTVGGEPLYPHPTESRCLTRNEVRENALELDPPLPLTFSSVTDTMLDSTRFKKVIDRYLVQGGNGNFYVYTLGDLMNPLLQANGDLIQLLKPCTNTIPQTGLPSAQTRLDSYCTFHPLKGVLNGNAPRPADTHFSRSVEGQGSVCKAYWYQNNTTYPNQSHMWWGRKRIDLGIDCVQQDYNNGITLSNPSTDFNDNGYDGATFTWHARCDVNNPAYDAERCEKESQELHGYAWSDIEKHMPWGMTMYPELDHVDVSHAGGLRCEPRVDPLQNSKPYGIDKQIEEKIKFIIQEPNITIVATPYIL